MYLLKSSSRLPLSAWNPFRERDTHLDTLLGGLMTGFEAARPERRWSPPVDIQETDEAYILDADLPGVSQDDISVDIDENTVTITGTRHVEHKEDGNGYQWHERHAGRFERAFRLPTGINRDNVKAVLENGVLRVTLPKRPEDKPRRIEVTMN